MTKLSCVITLLLTACDVGESPAQVIGRFGPIGSDRQCTVGAVGPRLLVTARHCSHLMGEEDFGIEIENQGTVQMVLAYDHGKDDVLALVLDRDLIAWDEPRGPPRAGEVGWYLSARRVSHRCQVALLSPWVAMSRCSPRSAKGDSGAPVADHEGRVWGIVSRGVQDTDITFISLLRKAAF